MNDGIKFGPATEVFAVDTRQFIALVIPLELCDFFFRTTDRAEVYELMAAAYNSRFDDAAYDDDDDDDDEDTYDDTDI